jgi:hypothetical protein
MVNRDRGATTSATNSGGTGTGTGTGTGAGQHTDKPTLLVRKNFVEKAKLSELLEKIKIEEGERVYRDSDRRHHKTDGIIFQPDAPYVVSHQDKQTAIRRPFNFNQSANPNEITVVYRLLKLYMNERNTLLLAAHTNFYYIIIQATSNA